MILVEEDKKRSVWGIKIVLVKAKTVLDKVKKEDFIHGYCKTEERPDSA